MNYRNLICKKENKIVTITLNRPEAKNAFDPETINEFSEVMLMFRDDPQLWVAIITGSGDSAFSAGADLKKLVPDLLSGKFAAPPTIMRGLQINKPIIAAVNGAALGGGLEVVLACDIRIAAEHAVFGVPEVKWGLIPGWGGSQRLPRMLPWARAAELLFLGKTVDAKEAHFIGLINQVVPKSELMLTAKEWALKICENGPLGVRAAKEAMSTGIEQPLEQGLVIEQTILDRLLKTEDLIEGLRAFSEKRKPIYKCK